MHKKSMDELLTQFDAIIPQLITEKFDMIIAINRGGLIPAGILNQKLNLPLHVININYRDDNHVPRFDDPQLLSEFTIEHNKNKKTRILLVDDVSRSGKTLKLAHQKLNEKVPCDVKTFVVNGNADYYLYNGECFIMPWLMQ